MPLYEYECDACGHKFEKIQKFSDPLVDKCPVCGGHVHKLFSSPAIQFKGSGFYITDYRKPGQTRPAEGDSKPASDPKPAADGKPAKAPAAKAPAAPASTPKK
jgi:putative FmdB family regulatory protein